MAVAERMYARALFEAAEEQGRVDAVKRDLDAFAEAVGASPELAQFLAQPAGRPGERRRTSSASSPPAPTSSCGTSCA